MIVTCPNCQTRYNLPDDKVPAGGAKVKCSKCAHVFKAELPPSTPEEEVESLLEEQAPATDTQAGDDFDETFNEMAAGAGGEPSEEPGDELGDEEGATAPAEPASDDAGPEESMPGMDDLFDEVEDASEPDESPEAPESEDDSLFEEEEDAGSMADDVEALFGDDEEDDTDDLFADDEEDEGGTDVDDLFGDDEEEEEEPGDAGAPVEDDLFAEDDLEDEGLEDEEGEEDAFKGKTDFGLDETAEEPKSNRKQLGCLVILLVVLLGLGAAIYFRAWTLLGVDLGTYFQNVPYIGKLFMEETGGDGETAPGESPADRVRKIELRNVKQYYVANEKTGNLFVVEGKAVNKFTTPKERIKVEVVLYDGTGNVLTSKSFLCGNVLSQFQLQVQTRKEIEEGLASEVGILSNNTFLRPGASTPFMAVFFEPPAGVKEFLVKVVDVGDPE
ncbi:DUF3426 domain-containing protein [Pseudodesulfovibrio cashew]|uniref:DUF3426 domain-containing protein n=1 Tax=Pseudodesulfovibrio cashew TaxID=2678688 RepID=A0A6I6JAR8_9BACT|nr:DUF3426 domain-containing protein [Pseudodesulfovibrio cashew]QGY39866.1 DUF3426 domain-containing protein [Pseudodesulfovibrio cashew]